MLGKFTIILIALIAALPGCAGPAISPAALAQVKQLKDQNAVALQNLQDKSDQQFATLNATLKANAAKGTQAPVSNPVAATNQTAVELHPWLFRGSIFFGVLAVLCLGLSAIGPAAGSITWLAWLKPVGEIAQVAEPFSVRSFCVVFAALMLLPFIEVTAIVGIVSLVALFIYEMVINKGNMQTVFSTMVKLVTGASGSVSISNISGGTIK